ncbi:MAG: hypothetical protein ABIG11_05520 [bacterium]
MRYWVYIDNQILGPHEKEKLSELSGFSPSILICLETPVGEKTGDWQPANSYPELASLLGSHPSQSLKQAEPASPSQEQSVPGSSAAELHKFAPAKQEVYHPAQELAKEIPSPFPEISIFDTGIPKPETAGASMPATGQDAKPAAEELKSGPLPAAAIPAAEQPAGTGLKTVGETPPPEELSSRSSEAGSNFDPMTLTGIQRKMQEMKHSSPLGQEAASQAQKAAGIPVPSGLSQEQSAALNAIPDKLNRIEEALSSMKEKEESRESEHARMENEVLEKLRYFESSLGKLEKAAEAWRAVPPQVQPVMQKSVNAGPSAAKTPEQAPAPKNKNGRGSALSKKTFLKLAIIVALLGGIGFAALKTLAGMDKLPAALNAFFATPAEPETVPPSPDTEKTEAASDEQSRTEEVLSWVKSYSSSDGSSSIGERLTPPQKDSPPTQWQVRPVSPGIYLVTAGMPSSNPSRIPTLYRFEVDFQNKTLKGENSPAQTLLAPIKHSKAKARTAPRQVKPAGRKNVPARARAPAIPKREPAKTVRQKPAKATAPAQEDDSDEYEYVYEDEEEPAPAGNRNFILPGIPRKK